MLDKRHSVMLECSHSKRHGNRRTQASHPTGEKGEPTHERKFLQVARIRQAENLGGTAGAVGSKKARHPLKQVTGLQMNFRTSIL